jgi:hypothetical protein
VTTNAEIEAIVDRLFDTIGNRVPALLALRQRVWDADETLAPQERHRVGLDAGISPRAAYWLGYRNSALVAMFVLMHEALTNNDVPWKLRNPVIHRLVDRLTAHSEPGP